MALAEIVPNPYHPKLTRIVGFSDETADVRTLRLQFEDADEAAAFEGWQPGQFGQFTVFGAGESVFALANAPWHPNGGDGAPTIECTFRTMGKVTTALRALSTGQTVGFRGPYGNHFPIDDHGEWYPLSCFHLRIIKGSAKIDRGQYIPGAGF